MFGRALGLGLGILVGGKVGCFVGERVTGNFVGKKVGFGTVGNKVG